MPLQLVDPDTFLHDDLAVGSRLFRKGVCRVGGLVIASGRSVLLDGLRLNRQFIHMLLQPVFSWG
jgi:hypothetical protein